MATSIDVILPVYNKAQYLPACMDALLREDNGSCTFIFVDDGSTDGSGALLDAAAGAHPNIIVRHTPNRGVSAARNLGISLSEGEWFTFCDADDLLLPGSLVALEKAAAATGCDMVSGLIEQETPGGVGFTLPGENAVLTDREAILKKGLDPLFDACYAKLYRRSVFGDLRFDEDLKVNEDGLFVLRALMGTPALCCIDTPVYRYRYAPGSASRKAFSHVFSGILTAGERKKKLAEAAGFPHLGAAFDARHRLMYLNKMASCTSGYTKQELAEARRQVLASESTLITDNRKERVRLLLIRHCFGLYLRIMQRNQ